MSFNKFFLIHRYIHFGGLHVDNQTDPLRKIRYIMEYITKLWGKYYKPGKYLTIDETMIKHTGKCGLLQYIKNKPVRWGVKTYLLCDAVSYYCLDAKIDIGKTTVARMIEKLSPTENVVVKLLEPYLNLGKVLFCDNFFTSIKLLEYLKQYTTSLVGTFRSNRIPKFKTLKIPDRKFFISYKMKNNNDFILTIWNDSNIVCLLNNAFPVTPFLKNVKTKTQIIPSIVNEYNQYKHGVDSNNQHTYHFRFPHKSNRWTKNVFYQLIQTSIFNAFIIYNKSNKKAKMKITTFYESIIIRLIGSKVQKNNSHKIHNIEYIDRDKKTRQRCVQCKEKRKTSWCCTVCLDSPVYLCIPDCYNDYHKTLHKK